MIDKIEQGELLAKILHYLDNNFRLAIRTKRQEISIYYGSRSQKYQLMVVTDNIMEIDAAFANFSDMMKVTSLYVPVESWGKTFRE